MKFLIVGGTGFIGRNLLYYFLGKGHEVKASYRIGTPPDDNWVQMDAGDHHKFSYHISNIRPDIVIYSAGNKDIKICEKKPYEAIVSNTTNPVALAKAAHFYGSKFVYISSDLVFSGNNAPANGYPEEVIEMPPTYYGVSKLVAEKALNDMNNTIICRSAGVYGLSSPVFRWLYNQLSASKQVECFADVLNTPTYVENLAEMILHLIENNMYGVTNCVGSEIANRYTLFYKYAEAFGFSPKLLKEGSSGGTLMRNNTSLSCGKLKKSGFTPDNISQGMKRYAQRVKIAGTEY